MSAKCYKDTLDSLGDAITVQDRDFNITYANRAARRLLNLKDFSTGLHQKCYKAFHNTDAPPDFCVSSGCWSSRSDCAVATYAPHLGKKLLIKAIPQFDSSARMTGLIHIARESDTHAAQLMENQAAYGQATLSGAIESFAPV